MRVQYLLAPVMGQRGSTQQHQQQLMLCYSKTTTQTAFRDVEAPPAMACQSHTQQKYNPKRVCVSRAWREQGSSKTLNSQLSDGRPRHNYFCFCFFVFIIIGFFFFFFVSFLCWRSSSTSRPGAPPNFLIFKKCCLLFLCQFKQLLWDRWTAVVLITW